MPTSFKPEVRADDIGKWVGNGLRFATRTEALTYLTDLSLRWFAVRQTRVIETDDPVNYRWDDWRGAVPIVQDEPSWFGEVR